MRLEDIEKERVRLANRTPEEVKREKIIKLERRLEMFKNLYKERKSDFSLREMNKIKLELKEMKENILKP